MSKVRGDKVGQELCRVMGINPFNVSSVTITCKAGEVAYATIERHLESEEVGLLHKILSEYDFVEKDKT